MPSNYGKSLNNQVAPVKAGLILRGEHHLLSLQFCTCATEDVPDLGRGLFSFAFLHK
jgi:hypothetical protein